MDPKFPTTNRWARLRPEGLIFGKPRSTGISAPTTSESPQGEKTPGKMLFESRNQPTIFLRIANLPKKYSFDRFFAFTIDCYA